MAWVPKLVPKLVMAPINTELPVQTRTVLAVHMELMYVYVMLLF